MENQTLYLNNEFYSIPRNTDFANSIKYFKLMSNMLSTLTGGGLGYDYWEQFGKDSNETYIDYAINSTVVKNEQLTYNGNLSAFRIDKKQFVLNSNLLNTIFIFTVNNPLDRLGP